MATSGIEIDYEDQLNALKDDKISKYVKKSITDRLAAYKNLFNEIDKAAQDLANELSQKRGTSIQVERLAIEKGKEKLNIHGMTGTVQELKGATYKDYEKYSTQLPIGTTVGINKESFSFNPQESNRLMKEQVELARKFYGSNIEERAGEKLPETLGQLRGILEKVASTAGQKPELLGKQYQDIAFGTFAESVKKNTDEISKVQETAARRTKDYIQSLKGTDNALSDFFSGVSKSTIGIGTIMSSFRSGNVLGMLSGTMNITSGIGDIGKSVKESGGIGKAITASPAVNFMMSNPITTLVAAAVAAVAAKEVIGLQQGIQRAPEHFELASNLQYNETQSRNRLLANANFGVGNRAGLLYRIASQTGESQSSIMATASAYGTNGVITDAGQIKEAAELFTKAAKVYGMSTDDFVKGFSSFSKFSTNQDVSSNLSALIGTSKANNIDISQLLEAQSNLVSYFYKSTGNNVNNNEILGIISGLRGTGVKDMGTIASGITGASSLIKGSFGNIERSTMLRMAGITNVEDIMKGGPEATDQFFKSFNKGGQLRKFSNSIAQSMGGGMTEEMAARMLARQMGGNEDVQNMVAKVVEKGYSSNVKAASLDYSSVKDTLKVKMDIKQAEVDMMKTESGLKQSTYDLLNAFKSLDMVLIKLGDEKLPHATAVINALTRSPNEVESNQDNQLINKSDTKDTVTKNEAESNKKVYDSLNKKLNPMNQELTVNLTIDHKNEYGATIKRSKHKTKAKLRSSK